MLSKLFSIITSRLLWSFLGITVLAAVIWLVGPLTAIGDYRPLEPELNRQIAIGAVYLIWFLCRLIPYLYNVRFNSRLLRNLHSTVAVRANENKSEINHNDQLSQGFREAAQVLRRGRLAQNRTRSKFRWLTRSSRQHLYQVPWYVIVGASGSGKTTALSNSGLPFPLKDRLGKSGRLGVDSSSLCNWWFTDGAVLLDTSGSYITRDGLPEEHTGNWSDFVALLKKYRPRQPINGVVVTVSVADLLSDSPEARAVQGNALRKRLIELHERSGINFPIYVLVTKADMLKGFVAYFRGFDEAQRNQIWGFTFPHERSQQPNLNLTMDFNQQYALLKQRLDAALPDVLLRENDIRQCADAYLFPQEFAALHRPLSHFLEQIFAPSSFTPRFMLRGVYFTSAVQKGAPVSQVLSEFDHYLQLPMSSRKLQVDPDLEGLGGGAWSEAEQHTSFFLKETWELRILREPGLASCNRWWEYSNRAVQWLGYAGSATILAMLGLLWLASYDNNKRYLAEVSGKIPQIQQQGQSLARFGGGTIFSVLPLLNSVENLPDSQNFSPNSPPLTYRLGLYRGGEIRQANEALYRKVLKDWLLPYVAIEIATTLIDDNHNDTDFSYEALKAYQMLYLPKHYDGEFLRAWVMLNLQRKLPQGSTQEQLKQLEWHLSRLLGTQVQTSPFTKDDNLVEQTQIALKRVPLPQRIYERLKRLLLQRDDIKPVSLMDLAGPQGELILSRRSAKPLTDGVPGLFTAQGYWRLFNKSVEPVANTLREEDNWVLNGGVQQQSSIDLIKTVRQIYMQEFITVWDDLLGDVQLASIGSLAQRINSARLLSGSSSAIRNLLVNASKHVVLRDEESDADSRSFLARTEDKLNRSASRTLDALFMKRPVNADGDVSAQPEHLVMAHFASLLALAQGQGGDNKTIPFDDVLKLVDELYSYLMAVQDAANSGLPAPKSDIVTRLQAASNRLPVPFKQMLLSLAIGASSDMQSTDMQNVRKQMGVEIGKFCQQAVAQRYPLAADARQDVKPDDLARMFAPNSGLMDSFFQKNLLGKVDTTHANWRFIPGVDGKTLPGDQGMLVPFQQAQYIRDAFFSNGTATPSYRVTVRPLRMDSDILDLTLDVDGQLFKYSHGPLVPLVISWPGTRNTNQVHLQLTLANGTTASAATNGAWALNRLIDMADTSLGTDGLSREATFNLNGHHVTLEFTPNSIHNPFQLPVFSCPST